MCADVPAPRRAASRPSSLRVASKAFSRESNSKLKAKRKEKTVRARVARWTMSRILISIRLGRTSMVLPATKSVSSLCSSLALDGAPVLSSTCALFAKFGWM
jgi:hypothetical protein